MGDVINLDEHRPHMAGQARCTECGHQWAAAAPLGTDELECPKCHTLNGAFVAPEYPDETMLCECGNQLFYVYNGVATCVMCGLAYEF